MAEKKKIEGVVILTPMFRVSYPKLFKPGSVPGSDKLNYSLEMLFEKKTTDLSVIQKPVIKALQAKWGTDKTKYPKGLRMPIKDGDKPDAEGSIRPEAKGMWIVRASSSADYPAPQVVARDPDVELTEEGDVYPGCYARAELKAFAYDTAGNKGVKFILNSVQFWKDGEALGGRKPANQVFGTIEGDDGDPDMPGMDTVGDEAESSEENFY